MTIHVTPIPSTISLTTPAFTLGTTSVAGGAATAIASNSTVQLFTTQVPTTIAYSDSASVGTNAYTSREDHVHGMAAATPSWSAALVMAYQILD